jgi:uncharacterized damage-inducible protein DinB
MDKTMANSGISWFQTPARVAYHTVEALDAYFLFTNNGQEFAYGGRFGAPWWEMNDEQLPKRPELISYLEDVEKRITRTFSSLEDQDLSAPFVHDDWSGETILGHIVYALRHTMHHQGALSVLSTYHGHEGESWA